MNETGAPRQQPGQPYPGAQQEPSYYPPGGTYPGPTAQPVYGSAGAVPPPAAEAPVKTRRVGTITMGIALVVLGVVLVLGIFVPQVDYIFLAQLAPIVLVVLGAEILIAHIRHRDEKLRYDFLSIIICILLIGASLFAATVPLVFRNTIDAERTAGRLSAELEDKSYEAFSNKPGLAPWTVYWNVSMNGRDYQKDMGIDDITRSQYVYLNLYMDSEFDSAEAFTKACKDAAGLLDIAPHLDNAEISSGNYYDHYVGDERYRLDIDGRRLFDLNADELVERVVTEYWVEEGYYVSEWEYNDRLAHPENYGVYPDDYDSFDAPPDEVNDTDPLSLDALEAAIKHDVVYLSAA